MRVYYLSAEYEAGKHKILKVWSRFVDSAMPEDSPRTAINASYSVLELDERYNRLLAKELLSNSRPDDEGIPQPDKYYVDGSDQLRDEFDNLVTINPNPQRQAYKLSQLYGLTQAQLETYIDNQFDSINSLAEAKTIIKNLIKKMAAIELYLVKQSRLDE